MIKSTKILLVLSVIIISRMLNANFIQPFGTIKMEIRETPSLAQVVPLFVTVTSDVEVDRGEIELLFPAGVEPVNQITKWVRHLPEQVPVELVIPIRVKEEGIWEIRASAVSPSQKPLPVGFGSIYLDVTSTTGRVITPAQLVKERLEQGIPFAQSRPDFQPEVKLFDPSQYLLAEPLDPPVPYDTLPPPGRIVAEPTVMGCDGDIKVFGYLYYYDENDNFRPVVNASTYIWDADTWPNGDDPLGSSITDWNGYFEVDNIENCDCWLCGTLDVYVEFWMWNTKFRVYYSGDSDVYEWRTSTRNNVSAGDVDFGTYEISNGDTDERAVWIFQDMNQAWNYATINGHDPGDIRCEYPIPNSEYAYALHNVANPAYIHISPNASDEPEVVIHEYAHGTLYNAGVPNLGSGNHTIYSSVPDNLSWNEGFAHFFAFAVLNSPIIDVSDIPGYNNLNLETFASTVDDGYNFPNDVPTGETNEARVAGAMWDILDNTNDGYDQYGFGFSTIYDIVWEDRPMNTLFSFWNAWKSATRYGAPSYGAHGGVSAIYNNTIDYNSRSVFSPSTASVSVSSIPAYNVLNVNNYISDSESPDSYLDLTIISTSPPSNPFGATIDGNHYLDLTGSGWSGNGSVTIRASDGLENSSNQLTVSIHVSSPPPSCPYVFTWDGNSFIEDNNILPTSEFPENADKDLDDYYLLQQPLVKSGDHYILQVREFENEHSYFDKFELWAVDHTSDLKIAVTNDGKILTFKKLESVGKAVHQGKNVSHKLQSIDDISVRSVQGDKVIVNFDLNNRDSNSGSIKTLIGSAQRAPVPKEEMAGSVHITGENGIIQNSVLSFVLRENESMFAIPLGSLSVESLEILWNLDFSLNYI